MMFLRHDGAVFAKVGQLGSWTQETDPGAATAIAVSATGIQMYIQVDGSLASRQGIGWGWTPEVGPGNAGAIALTKDTMMFLRGDKAAFAKVGRGGPWTQQTNPNGANDSHRRADGPVYAQRGRHQAWRHRPGLDG
jgi:hypothetical protein